MWKILIAFLTHRFLLLLVCLFAINAKISPQNSGRAIRPIQPRAILFQELNKKISEGSEVRALSMLNQHPVSQVFQLTQDPFLWLARGISFLWQDHALLTVIILSNLFFLLFLRELYLLSSRMALPEVASGAGILAILWMTSYEMSLGSNLSLGCFLVTFIFRSAIDNDWIFAGLGFALLAFTDRLALGLLPLIVFLFWHFNRFDPASEVLKKGLLLSVPVLVSIVLKWRYYQDVWLFVQGSALVKIIGAIKTGNFAGWPLSQENLGQTISLLVFLLGAVAAAVVNSSLILRSLPLLIFLGVLSFSSYNQLASRLLLAGICFEGITATVSGLFIRLIQLALIILSCYEIVSLF